VEAGDHDRGRIGLKVILPSTFTGGPRYMQQACADAIAVCTKYGKPDAFITMTCNPYWPEIRAELLSHQQPSDRPDLYARVFNLRRKALMEDLGLKEGRGFGQGRRLSLCNRVPETGPPTRAHTHPLRS